MPICSKLAEQPFEVLKVGRTPHLRTFQWFSVFSSRCRLWQGRATLSGLQVTEPLQQARVVPRVSRRLHHQILTTLWRRNKGYSHLKEQIQDKQPANPLLAFASTLLSDPEPRSSVFVRLYFNMSMFRVCIHLSIHLWACACVRVCGCVFVHRPRTEFNFLPIHFVIYFISHVLKISLKNSALSSWYT